MHIAITGATGHIGAAVVRVLAAEGHTLRALVRKDTRALNGQDIDMIQGDLLDPGAVDRLVTGCEVVIHLAARISLDGDRHGDVHRTNVEGTRLVLDACVRHQVRRMVHFASVHAFQTPQPGARFDESLPLAGPAQFAYERSKGEAMGLVLERGRTGTLETIVLCPTAVIGPWDVKPSRQGNMLIDLWKGHLPVLPRGGFNWVDSRDVARAALSAMTNGQSGEAYLLGGHYATVQDIARISSSIIEKRLSTRLMPDALLNGLAGMMTRWARWTDTEPIITREALSHLRTGHPAISTRKAAAAFGFQPRPLEKTLLDTYRWFQEQEKVR